MSSALVLVASRRASQGIYEDTSGPILAQGLRDLGFTVELKVVDDGEPSCRFAQNLDVLDSDRARAPGTARARAAGAARTNAAASIRNYGARARACTAAAAAAAAAGT